MSMTATARSEAEVPILTTGASQAAEPPARVPALREDLSLHSSTPDRDGAPTWTILDPLRGRYFHIGWMAFRLLAAWHHGTPDRIVAEAARGTTLDITPDDLDDLVLFLRANNLVAATSSGQAESYLKQWQATQLSWSSKLLHNYLFFRIPVLRPDRLLERLLPWISFIFTRTFFIGVGLLGLLGIVLVIRRWDEFLATFLHFFSLEGAALMAMTLGCTKIVHEFGHALTAKRYGCRVHSMGVAFLVMAPVLYTDVTDAWRLDDRRKRLWIASAGIITELTIALLATFAWCFLPEGMAKSVAFMLATVTWITTLVVNLNPMMKFDGYFIFSDLVGIDNLQDRSFALCRWRLREFLFGLDEPAPEALDRRTLKIMYVWGYVVWVWRFFLFLGIALLVYHFFFKLLGIFLMMVELAWFIWKPFANELREWWKRREQIRLNAKVLRSLALLAGALLMLVVPWQFHVSLPASMHAREYTTLFPPAAARVDEARVKPEQWVAQGEVIYRLTSPELDFESRQVARQIEITRAMIARQAASADVLGQASVMQRQLATYLANEQGLAAQREKLIVRAPFSGRLKDVPPGLSAGQWVSPRSALGRLVSPQGQLLVGYVTERELNRVRVGAEGVFYAEDILRKPVEVRVVKIDTTAVTSLDNPILGSSAEGPIAVRPDQRRGLVPVEAHYRVWMTPVSDTAAKPEAPQADGDVLPVLRGRARLEADANSPLAALWRTGVAVLLRETGF